MSLFLSKLNGYQPLSKLDGQDYLLYKKGEFLVVNKESNTSIKSFKIGRNFISILKESTKLTQRLFRTRIRSSLAINNREVIYSKNGSIYHLDISNQTTKIIFRSPKGFSTPLNITKSISGNFVAVFGDYGGNPEYQEVNVYGITNNLTIKKIYTFKKNTIKHIHNIVPNIQLNGYYILTGDNETSAGIYLSDLQFKGVKPIFTGTPKARVVAAFDTNDGLLCATDSVSEKNYIYLLNPNSGEIKKKITQINGSCIYATKCASGYLFSTTVEPPEESSILNLFTFKRGSGILNNSIDLIYVSKNFDVKRIKSFKKDVLPGKLFQFGAVMFANAQEDEKKLLGFGCSIKEYDSKVILFDVDL